MLHSFSSCMERAIFNAAFRFESVGFLLALLEHLLIFGFLFPQIVYQMGRDRTCIRGVYSSLAANTR